MKTYHFYTKDRKWITTVLAENHDEAVIKGQLSSNEVNYSTDYEDEIFTEQEVK